MTSERFTDDQIIRLLLAAHDGQSEEDLCRSNAIDVDTFLQWKSSYADQLDAALVQRLKSAEIETERLKTLAENVETRQVTILLSDIRGFTAMSERYSAHQVVKLLNRYFERMTRIILDYGGTIDKFMGDSIMALFGAPKQRGDDVARALACAVEMQIAMEIFNHENMAAGLDKLYMGIGINTGEVIAGRLGSLLHSEYTVIGDQVNLASRIEAHTLRGQILISENTFQLAQDYIDIGLINEVSVKGKMAPIRMIELRGVHKPRSMKVPQLEIRSSPRVEVDIPISYQILSEKTVMPAPYFGTIADLGYGGMRMTTDARLDPFTDVKVLQLQPLLAVDQMSIYAKVRRLTEGKDAVSYHLEFTSIDPASQKVIKAHVDTLVQRR